MKSSLDSVFYKVLLFTAGVSGFISNVPLNAVSEVGTEAILNCTSSTTLQHWVLTAKREDLGTSSAQDIALNCVVQPGYTTNYEVDRPGGSTNACNLIVKATTMQQAGVYTCSDSATGPSAVLTVIESSPNITYNTTTTVVENEIIINSCSLKHNGSVAPAPTLRPYFYWTDSNGQNVSSSYDSTTENEAVSQLTVTAGRQNIMAYTCHVYFQLMPPTSPGYASNTPIVNNNASSPTIEVLYGSSAPVITSRPEVITNNGVPCGISVLMCNSTGNPPPSYKWIDSATNSSISDEQTLTLAEVNRIYKCEVYNKIRNVLYTTSETYIVSRNDSVPHVNNCVYPRDETTSINVVGCDNGTSCDCSGDIGGVTLVCNANTYPNAKYIWSGTDGNVVYSQNHTKIAMNGRFWCTAYFDSALSNYSGSVTFTNGTNETTVSSCYDTAVSTATTTMSSTATHLTSTTTPHNSSTPLSSVDNQGVVIGIVIGSYVLINSLATFVFLWYYNSPTKCDPMANVGTAVAKTYRNKVLLNTRFSWMDKALPCMNTTTSSIGTTVLWICIFIFIALFSGIFTFPILIFMANKAENKYKQEHSGLNLRETAEEPYANGAHMQNMSPNINPQISSSRQTTAARHSNRDDYPTKNRENDPYGQPQKPNQTKWKETSISNSNLGATYRSPPPKYPPPQPAHKPDVRGRPANANQQEQNILYAPLPIKPQVIAAPQQYIDEECSYAVLKKA